MHRSLNSCLVAAWVILLGCLIPLAALRADDDAQGNPTGNTGSFNGEVTTGCSYDPFTGNAKRVVTDVAVPASNGAYPLAFTRIANTRASAVGNDVSVFGDGGNWRHSYQWAVSTATDSLGHPSYTIAYPDGRVIKFRIGRTAAPSGETWLRGQPGLSDRLEVDTSTTLKLHLSDGGVVHFKTNYYGVYQADQIIDPYGAVTTLTYTINLLSTVTEPGGRNLYLSYSSYSSGGATWVVLTAVTPNNGSSSNSGVTFGYQLFQPPVGAPYYVLSSATYKSELSNAGNGSFVAAAYTYTSASSYRPLLLTLNDPHYAGAMTHLRYAYSSNASYWGLITAEQNVNTGASVSTLNVDNPGSVTNAVETRGDQGLNAQGGAGTVTRQFLYGQATNQGQATNAAAYQVTSATDFDGNVSYTFYNGAQSTSGQGYVRATLDPLGYQTNYATEPYTGKTTAVQLPDGRLRYAQWGGSGPSDTLHPYYQYSSTDERNHTTYFTRPDATHLVSWISYADGSHESFAYQAFPSGSNPSYYKLSQYTNQLGGIVTYTYGASSGGSGRNDLLVSTSKNYGFGQAVEVTTYVYDALDRLIKVSDARGVSDSYTYTGRNQVASVTHADTLSQVYAYDDYGNPTSVTDEWNHVGRIAYDEYRRPITVTKASDSTNNSRSITYSYRRQNASGTQIADALTHTSSAWSQSLTGANRGVRRTFTNGGQVASERIGLTSNNWYDLYDAPPASTTTSYVYNGNHQISKVTGPSGNVTKTTYDNCGRVWSVTDPNGHVASQAYYPANDQNYPGLLKSVTLPGNGGSSLVTQYVSYDNLNHLLAVQDPAAHQFNDATDSAGNPTGQDDGDGASHNVTYKYDCFGRKLKVTQAGGQEEKWDYDLSGNVSSYTARNGAKQTFTYDLRNRLKGYTWSDSTNPLTISYDDSAQTKTVINNWASLIVYYNAAHEAYREDQLITGQNSAWHTTTVSFDADGLPIFCATPSGGSQQWARDKAGNVTTVSDQTSNSPQGYFTYSNGRLVQTDYTPGFTNLRSYQPNGRVSQTVFKYYNGSNICVRDYGFYPNGQKNWMYEETNPGYLPAGYGSAYQYNPDGSLLSCHSQTTGTYGGYDSYGDSPALNVSGGRYSGATAGQGTGFDAAGNRVYYSENGVDRVYTANVLDAYASATGLGFSYDTNANLTSVNGVACTYDSENRLISATGNGHSASFWYDGFGRLDCQLVDGVRTFFYFLGNKIVEERNANDGWTSNYVFGAGGERFCQYAPSGLHQYYHYDDVGHVTHVTDSNGAIREQYIYDPFGEPYVYNGPGTTYLSQTSALGNRHVFCGSDDYDW